MSIDKHQLKLGGIIAACLVLYAGAVWWPQQRSIANLRAQIAEAEGELGIARGQTTHLADLARQVDELRAYVAANNKVIPPQGQLSNLLRELSLQIEQAALEGQGIKTSELKTDDEVISMPVELTFHGRSTSVFELVERLEAMPSLTQINRLELMRRADSEDPQVRGELELTTYFSPGKGDPL